MNRPPLHGNPQIHFPSGGAMVFNNGSQPGQPAQFTINVGTNHQPSYNHHPAQAQYRHPQPPPQGPPQYPFAYYQTTPQFTTPLLQQGQQFFYIAPGYEQTYVQQAPPQYHHQQAQYHQNGDPASYPYGTSFVGPPAIAISTQPILAPHQQTPSVSVIQQSNNTGVGASTIPVGMVGGGGGTAQHQQSHESITHQAATSTKREKKMLQIVDPTSGEDKTEELLKERKEHDRVTGVQNRPGGLWKPSRDQLLGTMQESASNLPTNVAVVGGSPSAAICNAIPSDHRPPSRNGSITPHLEQPKDSGVRSNSRAQSPALDVSQNKDAKTEFFFQFAQQLGASTSNESNRQVSEDQSPQTSIQDSSLMPPPSNVPPLRASSFSKKESRQSSSRTTSTSSTSATVPNHVHSKPFMEFGVDHSAVTTTGGSKKPKDIIGDRPIEFGNLDTSANDKSLEAIDVGQAASIETNQQQSEKEINIDTAAPEYCSTPQKQQHQQPPADNVDSDAGRRSDTAPKSPRDRGYPHHPHSAQSLLNGNSSNDKFGFTVGETPAAVGARNSSYDHDESIEEGELRDMVFERTHATNGNNTMTGEQKAAITKLVDELKTLEAPDGRKCYSHEFMTVASKLPSSITRPQFETSTWSKENMEEVFNINNKRAAQNKLESRNRAAMSSGAGFAPEWMPAAVGGDNRARPSYPGRTSDTGSMRSVGGGGIGGGGGGGRGSRQGPVNVRGPSRPAPMVIARPSINVELKTSENAWKPGHKASTVEDPDQAESQKLFKEVRGLMNKITPQMFDELSKEFIGLEPRMNTPERARGIVDIVFQKAIDEPSFCALYSELYNKMTLHQLKQVQQLQNATKGSSSADYQNTNFRRILLNKCQQEFDGVRQTDARRKERETAIEIAETAEQKKKLQDELEEYLSKEKRRTLGNMRFIGELYLKNMLTNKIMHHCIMTLFQTTDEEYLECLCKLLSTIGSKLETDDVKSNDAQMKLQSDKYYERLRGFSTDTSPRVKFMILDLLDLRSNQWIPRRKEQGPKTIEQLHSDAEKEKVQQQKDLAQEEAKKRHEAAQDGGRRGGGGGGGGASRGGREMPNRSSYGGPQEYEGRGGRGGPSRQSQSRASHGGNNQQPQASTADLSKIKQSTLSQHNQVEPDKTRLGPSRKGWGQQKETAIAAAAPAKSSTAPKLTNRFGQLSSTEIVSSAPSSRDSSQTRVDESDSDLNASGANISTVPKYEEGGAKETAKQEPSEQAGDTGSDSTPSTSAKPEKKELDVKHFARELLDELIEANNTNDALKAIDEKIADVDPIMMEIMNHLTDKCEKSRPAAIRALGTLIANAFSSDTLKTGVVSGLSSYVKYVIEEDIAQDVPKVWIYIGQVIGQVLSTPNQEIDLMEFASVFQEADNRRTELLAQTLLAIKNLTGKEDAAIAAWHSISNRIAEIGLENMGDIESHLRRRDLNYLFEMPSSAFEVCSSSSGFSEPTYGGGQSPTAASTVPSSLSTTATASVCGASACDAGQFDGVSAASRALSTELDPDVVEMQRFVKMGDTFDVDGLINFIESRKLLGPDVKDEKSINFLGALVKSLCSKLIVHGDKDDKVEVDAEAFGRCSNVLTRFVTTHQPLEMKTLDTMAEVASNIGCPKGLLVNMFSMSLETNVIPTETLQEWWSKESLPGMLRMNGELKAFFADLMKADESGADGGSDSDQGEMNE